MHNILFFLVVYLLITSLALKLYVLANMSLDKGRKQHSTDVTSNLPLMLVKSGE